MPKPCIFQLNSCAQSLRANLFAKEPTLCFMGKANTRVFGGILSRVSALVDTVIRLRRASQADLAERAGIHPSNLSKFLSGDTDIRMSSLEKILDSLEISLEEVLELEIEKLIGRKKDSKSLGHAIEVLLSEADPISAKTFIDSLSSRMTQKKKKEVLSALNVVNDYKSKIRTVRRS